MGGLALVSILSGFRADASGYGGPDGPPFQFSLEQGTNYLLGLGGRGGGGDTLLVS